MSKIIAVSNQKGGVGKTTTTINLAASLAMADQRVLVVDMDPQGNLTSGLGQKGSAEHTVYEALLGDEALPILQTAVDKLHLVPAGRHLAAAEVELVGMEERERRLARLLAAVRPHYDFILIDTPPSLGLLTINAFTTSTGVIVPVQLEYLSLRGLVQLESTLQMIREHLNPVVHIEGILPTMVEGRTVHGREALDLLQANFQDLVFETRIKKSVKLAEAPVQGGSVLSYQPDGAGANAYRALAEEVLSRVE
jgi:chromosome partitioning protein